MLAANIIIRTVIVLTAGISSGNATIVVVIIRMAMTSSVARSRRLLSSCEAS